MLINNIYVLCEVSEASLWTLQPFWHNEDTPGSFGDGYNNMSSQNEKIHRNIEKKFMKKIY